MMVKRKGARRQPLPTEDVLSDASSDDGLDMIGGDDERNDYSDLDAGDEEVDVMSIGSEEDGQQQQQQEDIEDFDVGEAPKEDKEDDRLAWGRRDRDFYGSRTAAVSLKMSPLKPRSSN
ncbi:hypothetical protein FOZ62_007175 [Perkinsus olseni]|uniref:Uncharacterized protein n=1 Tax=Perkinsus olseni TaxID=32597 RepID=A0A7J6PFA9_PEROL|nr:hypothetical protein FOZ62_007175 [Perkinsus olseni]